MKIAICDDSAADREKILACVLDAGENDITLFSSGEEFLQSDQIFDLLFLDTELGTLSGIDVMHDFELRHSQMLIVFCSGRRDKAPESYGINVIGFLSKPAESSEIHRSIERARSLSSRFSVITADNISFYAGDVFYLRMEDSYTIFYCTNDKKYLSDRPLREWETKLMHLPFHRISRSCIVNFQKTLEIRKNELILTTGEHLAVSRRLSSPVAEKFKHYHREQMRY